MKIRYRDRLRAHPGKGAATLFTLIGAVAGAESLAGAFAGAAVTGAVSWGIVLWTARTQPVHEDDL